MANDLLQVPFRQPHDQNVQFEILSLQNLLKRKLNHLITKPHIPQFYLILFFLQGTGKHMIDFREYAYQKGDLLFAAEGQVHQFEIHDQNDGFLIPFTTQFFYKNQTDFSFLKQCHLFNIQTNPKISLQEDQCDSFFRLVQDIKLEYSKPNDLFKEEILRSLLRLFLYQAERIKESAAPNPLSKPQQHEYFDFLNLLELHFRQNRNANFYAQLLNISPKKLNHLIKENHKKTIKTFIDERVLLEIKRLLAYSCLSIKEIAYTTGFDEPTNLVKFFKKHTQKIPSEFRKDFTG